MSKRKPPRRTPKGPTVVVVTRPSPGVWPQCPPKRRREIAALGGRAAQAKGTAHRFNPKEAKAAGQKGGRTISKDRAHMARIGAKGGGARAPKP